MTRPFRTEPEASAELENAAVWYESRRSGLGVEFLEAVDATLDRIARCPRQPGVFLVLRLTSRPAGARQQIPLPRRVP